MMYFAAEELSAHKARTPEGFILLSEVPIARCGTQIYGLGETTIEPGPDGYVHIDRKPEEVFRPETIASFNAKPIINDDFLHATGAVTPDNWKTASVGVVLDVRRGEGLQSDLMIADMLICDADAIEAIEAGKRQISCGYRCEYVKTGEGRGEQRFIVGNHVALVERARCGAICSIGDEEHSGVIMKLIDKIKCAFEKKDKAALDKALEEVPAGVLAHDAEGEGAEGHHVHVHLGQEHEKSGDHKWNDAELEKKFGEHDKRFGDLETTIGTNHKAVMDSIEGLTKSMKHGPADAAAEGEKEIEGSLKEEAPAGTGDAALTKDSSWMGSVFQETLSLAEIIAPGIRPLPTFDATVKPSITYLDICKLRQRALELGNHDPLTNGIILEIHGKELTADSFKTMSCTQVGTLFRAVGRMKMAANTNDQTKRQAAAASDKKETLPIGPGGRKPMTVAEMNEYNRAYYGQRSAAK